MWIKLGGLYLATTVPIGGVWYSCDRMSAYERKCKKENKIPHVGQYLKFGVIGGVIGCVLAPIVLPFNAIWYTFDIIDDVLDAD